MAAWESTPGELSKALDDATNSNIADEASGPHRDEEKYRQAREAGWVEPQAYNYAAADARLPTQTELPTMNETAAGESPQWMHKAARYEWQEEFGDVGPEVPELEAQLFNSDLRTRTGQFLDK